MPGGGGQCRAPLSVTQQVRRTGGFGPEEAEVTGGEESAFEADGRGFIVGSLGVQDIIDKCSERRGTKESGGFRCRGACGE